MARSYKNPFSRSQPGLLSMLAVVAIMAERLTFLVTCFVVLSKSAFVVPGLYQSGSALLDEWNLFPRVQSCTPIKSRYGSYCSNFTYNTTRRSGAAGFNFLHHATQREAHDLLRSFDALIETGCSRDLPFLLCAYHFPICHASLQEPITPCQNLCERVKTDCSRVLESVGKEWPATMNCTNLLNGSKLEGERMHVCVANTEELDQATRATPLASERPTVASRRTESTTRPAPTTQRIEPTTEAAVTCPKCKSQRMKKKIVKKSKFNWVFAAVAEGYPIVKAKRQCWKVNITHTIYSYCNNSQHPEVGQRVNVCILRQSPTCPLCLPVETNATAQAFIFGGKAIRSSRYIIDLNDAPLFVPFRESFLKRSGNWTKKFYKKRGCPASG